MTEHSPTPPSAAEAVELARKDIAEIRESRTHTAVQYCFGYALGWLAAMRRAGILDWPTHDVLRREATEAMLQWQQPPEG